MKHEINNIKDKWDKLMMWAHYRDSEITVGVIFIIAIAVGLFLGGR